MTFFEVIRVALATVGLALILGALLGAFRAASLWANRVVFHQLNKRGSEKAYFVLSGTPELTQAMYDVCLRIAKNMQDNEPQRGIPVNDEPKAGSKEPKDKA